MQHYRRLALALAASAALVLGTQSPAWASYDAMAFTTDDNVGDGKTGGSIEFNADPDAWGGPGDSFELCDTDRNDGWRVWGQATYRTSPNRTIAEIVHNECVWEGRSVPENTRVVIEVCLTKSTGGPYRYCQKSRGRA